MFLDGLERARSTRHDQRCGHELVDRATILIGTWLGGSREVSCRAAGHIAGVEGTRYRSKGVGDSVVVMDRHNGARLYMKRCWIELKVLDRDGRTNRTSGARSQTTA
jgi:hypothetical protein